jgi:CRP-like cAMP-binding protein
MKLRQRNDVSAEEEQAIRSAISEVREVPADRVVIRAKQELDHSTLLLDGFMARYKDLRSGQRQISELHVAGDFVDLHSYTLRYLDHAVMALSPCRIALVPHENLRRLTEDFPRLARIFWFATNMDAAIHREWALSLGRRDARGRLAALFCELQARMAVVGIGDANTYPLPLTQTDIAECMGLTNIHVNRTLRQLRESGLVDFQGGRVTILDEAALRRTGEFDPAYLYLQHRPD